MRAHSSEIHEFVAQLGAGDADVDVRVIQLHAGQLLSDIFEDVRIADTHGGRRALPLVVRLPILCQIDKDCLTLDKAALSLSEFWDAGHMTSWESQFRRIPDRSVQILFSHDGRLCLSGNINPVWTRSYPRVYVDAEALNRIRYAEMQFLLSRSRAVLPEIHHSSYKLPSKRFARSFVRVGNIQYDRDAIDAVLFWLIPHLTDCAGILTDTWSISSLAMAASGFASNYFKRAAVPVEMLRSYADGSDASRQQIERSISRLVAEIPISAPATDKLLCLVSASQKGQLAMRIEDALTSGCPRYFDFVTLFSLSAENRYPALLDLSGDARFQALDDDEIDARDAIEIDPQVYFPLTYHDSVHRITKQIAERSADFLNAYRGKNVVKVHRTHFGVVPYNRHHAVHLDTVNLIGTMRFVRELNKILDDLLPRPSLIVHAEHPAGEKLAAACLRYFKRKSLSIRAFAHPSLGEPDSKAMQTPTESEMFSLLREFDETASILVLDDAFITGRRINQYNTNLRTLEFRGKIHFLVAVARPPREKSWKDAQKRLANRGDDLEPHSVKAVEQVILPNWNQNDCPWCIEKALYEKFEESGVLPTYLADRRRSLEQANGLTDDLFLRYEGYPVAALGPRSFYVKKPATQAEAFAGIASAVQHLRDDDSGKKPALGRRHFPVSTVLEHSDYLLQTWTDSVFRASFLRAAFWDELTYADDAKEEQRSKDIADLIQQRESTNGHDISLELILACLIGKCSLPNDPQVAKEVSERCTSGAADFLLERLMKK